MDDKQLKNKGGQPKKVLSSDDVALVYGLAAAMTQKQIADYLGMTEHTFIAAKRRQPELLIAYKKGKARAIAGATGKLLEQVQAGYFPAICFYLKTQAGWREKGGIDTSEDEDNEYKGPTPLLVEFVGLDYKDKMKKVKEGEE
jgi:hypothetical protein